jgi:polar amino acid transport system substrate-binding protein
VDLKGKNKMKKLLALLLSIVMIIGATLSFTACGDEDDWANVQEKGYFTCGITVYAPMNYFDDTDSLVGFDTELAKAVAEYLDLEVKFQIIDWPAKYLELNSGAIDLIWNGFTYGDEDGVPRSEYVDFTHSYLKNEQCIVVRTADLSKYSAKADLAGKLAGVEGGSSGEGIAKDLGAAEGTTLIQKTSQALALNELVANQVDYAVIDLQMAKAMVGKNDFASLSILTLSDYTIEAEVYAIGARLGSSLTAKINEALEALSENGTIATLAAKYGLENDVIANIGK